MSERRLAGLLLAAGLSSRMGTPKALLDWRGAPLVRYQVAQLTAAGCGPVIVVTGYRHEEIEAALAGAGATIAFNREYEAGRAGSLRVGARALPEEAEAIVVLNVDQPREAAVIRRLIDEFRRSSALLVVPAFQGRRGHPLILDGSLRAELLAVSEADEGLKAVVRRYQDRRIEVEFEHADVLLDLNTPEAYAAAARKGAVGREEPATSGE